MRYKRNYSRAELAKQSFEKTKKLRMGLLFVDKQGKKWVLNESLENLAKKNGCSERAALKMFHAIAKACKMGQLDPALLGAAAA